MNLFTLDTIPVFLNAGAATSSKENFKIIGKVSKLGVKIPCRVRLYEKISGKKILEVLTNADGDYEFNNLSKIEFFVIAHDPNSQYNAVIQDNVVPK